MSKGTYQVNDNENKPQHGDSSYKSCICALLIFLAICIIILLAGTKWSSNSSKQDVSKDGSELLGLQQGKDTNSAIIEDIQTPYDNKSNIRTHEENTNPALHPNEKTTTEEITNTSTDDSQTSAFVDVASLKTTGNSKNINNIGEEITTEEYTIHSTDDSKTSYFDDVTSLDTVNSGNMNNIGQETTTEDNTNTSSDDSLTSHFDGVTSPETVNSENMNNILQEITTEENTNTSTDYGSLTSDFDDVTSPETVNGVNINNITQDTTTEENTNTSSDDSLTSHFDDVTSPETVNSENMNNIGQETKTEENTNTSTDYGNLTSDFDDVTSPEIVNSKNINNIGQETTSEENINTSEANDSSLLEKILGITTDLSTEEVSDNSSFTETNVYNFVSLEQNINMESDNMVTMSENLETSTPTTVAVLIYGRENSNVISPSIYEATTDSATYSADEGNTATSTVSFQKVSEDEETDREFTQPNDSGGGYFGDYDESQSNPTTTQQSMDLWKSVDDQQDKIQQDVNQPKICQSAECKTVASRMLGLMNHSEKPCDNFYEFSCGEMQVDNNDRDTWERLLEQVYLIDDNTALPHFKTFKSFYTSCVDHEQSFNYTDRVFKVSELVKEVGWIIDANADPNSVDLTSLFAKLILRQSLPIFDVDVDIDRQTSKFILKIVPPQMYSMLAESGRWSTLSERQIRCLLAQRDAMQNSKLNLNKIYLSYLECQKDQEILLNSLESIVESLGFYSNIINSFNKSQLMMELRFIIEWDILDLLSDLPPPNEIRKTLLFKNSNYGMLTVKALQIQYPLVNWKMMFEMITGSTIPDDTEIHQYFPDYMDNIFTHFHSCKKCTTIQINNAFISMYAYNLYQNLVISQARHQREDYCIKLSAKFFQDIANNLYVKSWKNSDFTTYQTLSLDIFNELKNKLKAEVANEAVWLDDTSRQSLWSKLERVDLIVNKQEDQYNNNTYLAAKYQVDLIEGNWPSNAVKMLEKYRAMLYSIQGSDFSNDNLWSYFIKAYDSTPTTFYSQALSVAPLGTMKQHKINVPNYVTMIQIGLPLAREIGHHCDPEGIANKVFISSSSWKYYQYMMVLMKNNTLNTTMLVGNQEISFDVDAELSVNERIADNIAMRLLSSMYNESDDLSLPWISTSYSKQELFFISVAQEYCSRISVPEFMQKLFESEILPPVLRVKNIVTHSEEFSRTFQCSPETEEINNNYKKLQFPYLEVLNVEEYNKLIN